MKCLLVIVGLVVLVYGLRCFHKDSYKSAITCLFLAAVFLLADPTSFQGFLKTGIIAKLNGLGHKMDDIQEALVAQQHDLERTQTEIAKQQKTLAEQQSKTTSNQTAVSIAQKDIEETAARLAEQQKKLEQVDVLVNGLFDRSEAERFTHTETNRMAIVEKGGNNAVVILVLKKAPVFKSIRWQYWLFSEPPNSWVLYDRDILLARWSDSVQQLRSHDTFITYVSDPSVTNIQPASLVMTNDGCMVNGRRVGLNTDNQIFIDFKPVRFRMKPYLLKSLQNNRYELRVVLQLPLGYFRCLGCLFCAERVSVGSPFRHLLTSQIAPLLVACGDEDEPERHNR